MSCFSKKTFSLCKIPKNLSLHPDCVILPYLYRMKKNTFFEIFYPQFIHYLSSVLLKNKTTDNCFIYIFLKINCEDLIKIQGLCKIILHPNLKQALFLENKIKYLNIYHNIVFTHRTLEKNYVSNCWL